MTRPNFLPRAAAAVALLAGAVLGVGTTAAVPVTADAPPVKALLVIGGCCHDYKSQKDLLTKGVSARANVSWTIAYDSDTTTKHLNPVYGKDDWAAGFDVVVHDECSSDVKDPKVIDRILKPHRD